VTRAGLDLELADVDRLRREARITAIADRAVDMLARGRRTRRELERRLRARDREVVPEELREALDRLETAGLVSDVAVAEAEASSRLRRGEAPGRVRAVLHRKGVAAPLVGEALREAMAGDAFDERAACEAVAAKRLRSLGGLEPPVVRRRLQAFLLRRGFASSVVRTVSDRLLRRDE
jgi:regulatory protein